MINTENKMHQDEHFVTACEHKQENIRVEVQLKFQNSCQNRS